MYGLKPVPTSADLPFVCSRYRVFCQKSQNLRCVPPLHHSDERELED